MEGEEDSTIIESAEMESEKWKTMRGMRQNQERNDGEEKQGRESGKRC
jgi:hypothetical protein